MPSARISSKKEPDTSAYFVVEWLDSDSGQFSVIPRRKVVSDPPISVGATVSVKFTNKKGGIEKERARIISKGTKDAMEKSLDRVTCQGPRDTDLKSQLSPDAVIPSKSVLSKVTDSATILILNELKEIKEIMKHLVTKLDGVVSCTQKWNVNSFSPQAGMCKQECNLLDTTGSDGRVSPVLHNGIVLTDLHCSATSHQNMQERCMMSHVFSKKEMGNSLFNKTGASSKPVLSPNRCGIVIKCLKKKYSEAFLVKSMPTIRESLNQKCRDLKRKLNMEEKPSTKKMRIYCSSDEDKD